MRLGGLSVIMIDRESQGEMQSSAGSVDAAKGRTVEGCAQLRNDKHSSDASFPEILVWHTPPEFPNNKQIHNQEVITWPYVHSNYQCVQQAHPVALDRGYYQDSVNYNFYVENGNQYVPFQVASQGYSHDVQLQEFQYFVVIDFEATCDKDKTPQPQEIIEFPSVLVNSTTGQLEASFQTYVRPTYHQHLSDFCKELTGIQQSQVDVGVSLSEALLSHDRWLEDKGIKHTNFAVVTWSNWDCRVMLESECKIKKIRKPPYFNRWINLKVPFHEVFGDVRCNLKEAVQFAGLAWEGRAHCGLDDARNTARLLVLLLQWGFKFSITNSLVWPSPSQSVLSCASDVGQSPAKPKEVIAATMQLNFPSVYPAMKGEPMQYCFCGVLSRKCMVRKPGPSQGRFFYGCGNWTATRRAACTFFKWD